MFAKATSGIGIGFAADTMMPLKVLKHSIFA